LASLAVWAGRCMHKRLPLHNARTEASTKSTSRRTNLRLVLFICISSIPGIRGQIAVLLEFVTAYNAVRTLPEDASGKRHRVIGIKPAGAAVPEPAGRGFVPVASTVSAIRTGDRRCCPDHIHACVQRPCVHTATGQDAELTDDAVPLLLPVFALPSGGSTEPPWRRERRS
jgi:hypothetical protein